MHEGKRVMVITSRVHPGETQSSFALEGMVNFLLSDDPRAQDLRKNFIFYVVPMLNPDGVIQGNMRTDLCGVDMNRRWTDSSPWLHPVMYACRNLVTMIQEERKVEVFCDIHGHFQPVGSFMYCCNYNKDSCGGCEAQENDAMLRVVPNVLSNINEWFSMSNCTFSMEAYKANSARQAMFNEFKINNSFTLENSFFTKEKCCTEEIETVACEQEAFEGSSDDLQSVKSNQTAEPSSPLKMYDEKEGFHHFNSEDHRQLGHDLCLTLHKAFVHNLLNQDALDEDDIEFKRV